MLHKKRPKKGDSPAPEFLETPSGIFTTSGNWFRTRRDLIESYFPGLTDAVPFEKMIKDAEVWIRSTDMLGIIMAMIFLVILPLWPAIIAGVAAGLAWHILKSGFISLPSTRYLSWLDYEIVVLVCALIPLSYFGIEALYDKLVTGLILFVVFKFGYIRKLGDFLHAKIRPAGTPLNDRILNMVLTRHAIREEIKIPEIQRMEKEIVEAIEKTKQQHRRLRRKK